MPDVVWEILLSVVAVAAVARTVQKLPDLWHRPRPSDTVDRWFSADQLARAWPVVAVLGSIALVTVTVAVWVSDGGPGGAPAWAQDAVVATLLGLVVVGSAVGWLGRPRALVPPALRTRAGRDALHEATVHDVRAPAEHADEFEPYFIAMCSCDWVGEAKASEPEARLEAQQHTANVREEVERPLA